MRKARARGNPPTLAEVVHRAVEVCDPEGAEEGPAELLRRFEDRDEPVTAEADVEQEIAEVKGAIDPQDEDPAVVMTAAVATYLAFRRTELDRDRPELLRLAARAEFDGEPPAPVAGWLAEQGVDV
jgi:cell pole-organizing protein PopZ